MIAQVTLRARSESLPLLTELRSESLKDRHWRPLLRRLGIRVGYQELNLGLLWGSSLMSHRKDIGETVLAAQGEMALEEFLRQVREDWQGRELELVSYQGRIQLVKGWDALFSRLEEHLNGLQSMRASPHFHAVQVCLHLTAAFVQGSAADGLPLLLSLSIFSIFFRAVFALVR